MSPRLETPEDARPVPPLARMRSELRLPVRPGRRGRAVPRLSVRERWRQMAREGEIGRRAILGAPLLAVAFAIWAFGGVYGWAYGCAYLLVFAGLAAWSVQCWRGRLHAVWRPIYVPLLACAGFVGLQLWLPWSVSPASTLTEALHLGAAGTAFFLVTQLYRNDRDAGWLMPCFSVFTGALALLAIAQTLTAASEIYWHFSYTYASPAGSFVNRNNFAGCMEMLLPMACVEAYRRRRRGWQYVLPWALPPALGVAAVLLAASRGGLLALAVEACVAVVIFWVRTYRGKAEATVPLAAWFPPPSGRERAAKSTRERRRSLEVLGVAVVLTGVLVWATGVQRLQARVVATNAHAPSIEQREDLNHSSWAMFRQRPWRGWGLGTWAEVYPEFARFHNADVFAFAHNDYLQWLSEMGLSGVALAAAFWILWAASLRRRLRRSGAAGQTVALAVLVAGAGLAAHSWVDFNLHIPANLLLFFLLAGLAAGEGAGCVRGRARENASR